MKKRYHPANSKLIPDDLEISVVKLLLSQYPTEEEKAKDYGLLLQCDSRIFKNLPPLRRTSRSNVFYVKSKPAHQYLTRILNSTLYGVGAANSALDNTLRMLMEYNLHMSSSTTNELFIRAQEVSTLLKQLRADLSLYIDEQPHKDQFTAADYNKLRELLDAHNRADKSDNK